MARVVVPNTPHHVTQRGNRRQQTFFNTQDYACYRRLLARACREVEVDIWAYCLMPNHVHIVATPARTESLAAVFHRAHRIYTRRINQREEWRGHLWQERFHSFAMDERHLLMAVRYIELNPVRAGLCRRPDEWKWSSVHAHLGTVRDPLVNPLPMLQRVPDWPAYLQQADADQDLDRIRRHGRTGRPAGSDEFVTSLEQQSGRRLRRLKPGPKAADK